ncbi:hypothetical protein B9Z19DRAFT_1076965 [Tuber borchii]|uniref:Uncharacterized protein n=1 Tax=Tuber borchii TaxID=42251 RepID=A0A2T7A163_TUBBO|nr:hypothetical protein B9Z19DRAFT_1076965 [Tuber borchii]
MLVICLFAGLGALWKKGDRGKTDHSSLIKSTAQPSSAKPGITPTNSITITDPSESKLATRATTRTKRTTTVTSTIKTTLAPSADTTFPLWIGTFDSISPLVSFFGACKTSTSPAILQACDDVARFTTTIGESKPDGYSIGTTLWAFQDHLVPTERSGKQWYYSGVSVEKKYSHPSSSGCEVVEKAGMWLGEDGTYTLRVNYESTGACTLDNGRPKNPTAQVCECVYEGVFATLS